MLNLHIWKIIYKYYLEYTFDPSIDQSHIIILHCNTYFNFSVLFAKKKKKKKNLFFHLIQLRIQQFSKVMLIKWKIKK
jgi:hypothetical protein